MWGKWGERLKILMLKKKISGKNPFCEIIRPVLKKAPRWRMLDLAQW